MIDQQLLFNNACQHMPGGVNSPVRSFQSVGGQPRFIEQGKGAHLIDVMGERYIDYVGSWGAMILGHAYWPVVQAVQEAASQGLSFGAATVAEIEFCKLIKQYLPSIELLRLVNSGTEATMSAIRLARAYTERDIIVKFAGCYHGHSDALLIQAGSGALTFGSTTSPGVPVSLAEHTVVLPFNDLSAVEQCFAMYGPKIAAVIVEPISINMNCVLGDQSFIEGLRTLTHDNGTVLIFDEVVTGFRVGLGGAQALYNVVPDLTTLGKIIGGGLPVGAFGGRQEIMEQLAPTGPVYQAGTLSGNPITMAAGLATLRALAAPGFYERLAMQTQTFVDGMQSIISHYHVSLQITHAPGLFGLFFTDRYPIKHLADVNACSLSDYQRFFHAMLARGVYLAPSMFEAGFISAAHDDRIIHETLSIFEAVLADG